MVTYFQRRFTTATGRGIKGKNNHYLRIKICRETGEVSKVNEKNWTDFAMASYAKGIYKDNCIDVNTLKLHKKKQPATIDMLIEASKLVEEEGELFVNFVNRV